MTEREERLRLLRVREDARQRQWKAERNAELERERVVAELGGHGPGFGDGVGNGSPGGASMGQHGMSASASNAGSAAPHATQPQHLGWSGHIRPEEVIDKLTERIADRMRNELRLELQKESETLQQRVAAENLQMDDYLARELETQNTCPVCYELMVPPEHAPQLLFPCGHTFCAKCVHSHYVTHGKRTCPICRKKIDSKAPNYSLQQLILNFVQKRQRMQGIRPEGMAATTHAVVAGSVPDAAAPAAGDTGQSNDEHDRLRRQSERIQIRLTVLMNELTDTISEAAALEGAAQSSRLVLDHLGAQEQDVLKRMAALKAELELLQEQRSVQEAKVAKSEEEATAALSRRQMLTDTIGPLQAELKKIDLLMTGLSEQYSFHKQQH